MILAAADEWRPDVIVIGSHSRTGVDRLFLGSVAEHVMRSADCPVEVVPAGAFTDAEQDTAESASRGDRATSIPASSRSSSASGRATMRFSK
jgi:hypothetical protein